MSIIFNSIIKFYWNFTCFINLVPCEINSASQGPSYAKIHHKSFVLDYFFLLFLDFFLIRINLAYYLNDFTYVLHYNLLKLIKFEFSLHFNYNFKVSKIIVSSFCYVMH